MDYSLFFLSRWNEEVRAGVAILEATTITMYHTGHTIVVSGVTLAVRSWYLVIITTGVGVVSRGLLVDTHPPTHTHTHARAHIAMMHHVLQ